MAQKDKKTNCIEVPSFYTNEYDQNRKEVFEYRRKMATTQSISEDLELNELIIGDMSKIWSEVGGQDGMYENFPISRVYRDSSVVRVYVLDGCGGVVIVAHKDGYFHVLTLGEDDGWHFLNSRRIYEEYTGSKSSFIYLLSEALSLFNNIKLWHRKKKNYY